MRPPLPRMILFILLAAVVRPAAATVGLVVGEPFGSFGTILPAGHAGIYLDHICADTPTHLRPCDPGNPNDRGVVLSRYHDLRNPELDWMATPVIPFFYGVDDPANTPAFVTPSLKAELRESYREAHLLDIAPDRMNHGHAVPPPDGDWQEAIGATFDRRLFLYTLDTTPGQDARVLALLNDTPNHRNYSLRRNNCADFAADILDVIFPTLPRRAVLADFDMTTPKGLARQFDAFGHAHVELHPAVYEVPQLPGTLRRSRPLRSSAECFIVTKRYLATLMVLAPEAVLPDWIVYETKGKWTPGLNATSLTPNNFSASLGRDGVAPTQRPALAIDWSSETLFPLSTYSPVSTFSSTFSPSKGFLAK